MARPFVYTKILATAILARLRGDREGYAHRRRILAYRLLQSLSKEDVELVGVRRGGREWLFDLRGGPIPIMLFQGGEFQGAEIEALLNWMRADGRLGEGKVAVDVGANIGTTTIPLVDAGLEVIAIEPAPRNFDLLTWNIHRNGLKDRVHAIQAAVAATEGELEIVIDSGDIGGCEIRSEKGAPPNRGGPEPLESVRVPSLSLARVLEQCGADPSRVAFLWSDTQGFESEVLESGRKLWAAGVPIWVEVWPTGLRRHGGVDRFLKLVNDLFSTWLSPEDVANGRREGRPIAEFAPFVHQIGFGEAASTDALLLPREEAAT